MVKVAPAARQKRERKKNFMAKNFSLSYGMNRDCANPYGVCGQKDRFPEKMIGAIRQERPARFSRQPAVACARVETVTIGAETRRIFWLARNRLADFFRHRLTNQFYDFVQGIIEKPGRPGVFTKVRTNICHA